MMGIPTPPQGAKFILRGSIWVVNLNPTIGDEMQKERRCVVISQNRVGVLAVKVVVPLTEDLPKKNHVWHVPIRATVENGLTKDSLADALQIRSVSYQRFARCVGQVTDEELDDVVAAVQVVIGAV